MLIGLAKRRGTVRAPARVDPTLEGQARNAPVTDADGCRGSLGSRVARNDGTNHGAPGEPTERGSLTPRLLEPRRADRYCRGPGQNVAPAPGSIVTVAPRRWLLSSSRRCRRHSGGCGSPRPRRSSRRRGHRCPRGWSTPTGTRTRRRRCRPRVVDVESHVVEALPAGVPEDVDAGLLARGAVHEVPLLENPPQCPGSGGSPRAVPLHLVNEPPGTLKCPV